MRYAILYYSIQYQGNWTQIAKAIKEKRQYERLEYPYSFVTIVDAEYPVCFRKLRYPPWIVFYQGDFRKLQKRCVGIVGSRNCTQKALENTQIVVNHLKSKYCIVSGLAKGVDAQSHIEALDYDTIGIIGCGIDQIYPKENISLYKKMKETQLILSEYPMHVSPKAHHFPWRNRLIAALSDSLIVIEAMYKSGTMLTVNECLELSKPVYCLPTGFNESKYLGCNYLISSGANIIGCIEDLKQI